MEDGCRECEIIRETYALASVEYETRDAMRLSGAPKADALDRAVRVELELLDWNGHLPVVARVAEHVVQNICWPDQEPISCGTEDYMGTVTGMAGGHAIEERD